MLKVIKQGKRAMAKSKFPPLLHLTYILQQSSDELLLAEVGVGLSQARLMSGLNTSSIRSQHQLAVELNQTESNVSRQLQTMKKQGLVSIAKNKKDGRQRDVKLTGKGQTKYEKAAKILAAQQKLVLNSLNKSEAASLESAAQKLSA